MLDFPFGPVRIADTFRFSGGASVMSAAVDERRAPLGLFADQPTPRLYDRVIEVLRVHHYSRRTEKAYVGWIRRYIQFLGGRHPAEAAAPEVTAFLSQLAVRGNVAASTQNQALAALLFLYQQVLQVKLPWRDEVVRANVLSEGARGVTSPLDSAGAGYGYRDSLRMGAGEQDSPPAGPRTQPIPATKLAPYGSLRRHP
jgi:hypothetical protein